MTQDFDVTMRFIKQKLLASDVIHEDNDFTLFTTNGRTDCVRDKLIYGELCPPKYFNADEKKICSGTNIWNRALVGKYRFCVNSAKYVSMVNVWFFFLLSLQNGHYYHVYV